MNTQIYTVNGIVFYVTYDSNSNVVMVVVPEYKDPNTGQPLTVTYNPPIPFSMGLLESLVYLIQNG